MKKQGAGLLLLASALVFASFGTAEALTSVEANKKCAEWQASGGSGAPPAYKTTEAGGSVTCQCAGSKCDAQTYTDSQGNSQGIQEAMGFFQQALGMIQGLLGKAGGAAGGDAPQQGTGSLPSVAPSAANFMGGAGPAGSPSGVIAPQQAAFESATSKAAQVAQSEVVKEPSANFLEAVSKGFSSMTETITEVTVGLADKSATPSAATKENTQQLGKERDTTQTPEGEAPKLNTKEESSGVSGFYGANSTMENSGLSLVGRLCVTRPWAQSFISNFVSPSFFDGLCEGTGHNVGDLPETDGPVNATQILQRAAERASAEKELNPITLKRRGISCTPGVIRQGAKATLEFSCGTGERLLRATGFKAGVNDSRATVEPQKSMVYGISCSNNFEEACEVKVVNPRVAVWSEPKAIRLGSRAVIYWNTEDVEKGTCTVTGPSFFQSGDFGGASTVPITGPSMFTVTCTALDGEPVTEKIIVDLAL